MKQEKKSTSILKSIYRGNNKGKNKDDSITLGYKVIQEYFDKKDKDKCKYKGKDNFIEEFVKKLDKVFLIRVQVQKGVNLNHYFKIMDIRGEQLEPHEIIKARIIGKLNRREETIAATIWDACTRMDTYMQKKSKVIMKRKERKREIKVLEAVLRVTYTSPKSMHWIHITLKKVNESNGEYEAIIRELESYCRKKIKDSTEFQR